MLLLLSQSIFGFGCAGCGTAVILGAVGKAITGKYQTLALGVVMAAGSLGQFLLVPLAGYLIEINGWQNSIIYLLFISLVMVLCSINDWIFCLWISCFICCYSFTSLFR